MNPVPAVAGSVPVVVLYQMSPCAGFSGLVSPVFTVGNGGV